MRCAVLLTTFLFACETPRVQPDAAVNDVRDASVELDAGTTEDSGVPDAGAPEPDAGSSATYITQHPPTPACPDDGATITAFTLPARMDTNTLTHVTVTVKNTGATTWTPAAEYRLGGPGNDDPFTQNARVELSSAVAPGATTTFAFDLRAPATPGAYVTRWQLVKEHVCWFGDEVASPIDVAAPVATGRCEHPAPPQLDQVAAVVHIVGPTRITLDSTPKVCDRDYCAQIGFTDGRTCCPPRPEGHPDVNPCNEAIVGRARDTGRVGPTWTFDGQLCAPMGPGNCTNHPDNQFLLWVYGPGTARACGNLNGVCGEVVVR